MKELILIKAKLQETSETIIIINLTVMNMAYLLRVLFVFFSKSLFRIFKALYLPKRAGFYRLRYSF